MKQDNWRAVAAILIQTLFLILINTSIIAANDISALQKAIPYLNLCLLIMCLFNLSTIKKIESQAKLEIQNRLMKNHLEQVESILRSTEIKQHEYARHMQTLQALVELDKVETAREYINGITNRYQSDNLVYCIDHPAIAALINSKNSVAQVSHIDFAVAVKCDLAAIDIPDWDLCSILGVLLDNAFEAASIDPVPRVGVEFKYEGDRYLIYIINNGSRITEPARIFEAGYTTKASEGRGYGLYIADKLLKKYRCEIEIINKPKTTIILKIPGAGSCYDKKPCLEYG